MDEVLSKRKRRALITMLVSSLTAIVLLTAQVFLAQHSLLLSTTATSYNTHNSSSTETTEAVFTVTRVVDGDTILVNYHNTEEYVRLIGIDAPELHHPTKPVQCFGQQAADFVDSLLRDRSVYLVFDQSQDKRDKYGRLLAYVYRDDTNNDDLFINEKIIADGYAYEYTYNTPYKYQKEFKDAQTYARENQKGLWAPNTCNGDTSKTISKVSL